MRQAQKTLYPTSKVPGADIKLALRTEKGVVSGPTSAEFLLAIMIFIEQHSSIQDDKIPVRTTGSNILVSWSPFHDDGRAFSSHVSYKTLSGRELFINTNHPRFFALRQGGKLLEEFGLSVTEVGANIR